MISILDNFDLKAKKPDVARQLFQTVEEMVAFNENYLPDVYEVNVVGDNGNRYRFQRSNSVDPVLGKWRLASTGGESELLDYYKKSEVDSLIDSRVEKQDGMGLSSNDYTTADKEKLASLSNYDDTGVRESITNNQTSISDVQTIVGSGSLNTTDQTIIGAVNELKAKTDDTTLSDRVRVNEDAIAVLNGSSAVSGSVKKSVATCLSDAKAYTDAQIDLMSQNAAITCDEKPSYFSGTITYLKDGEVKTTTETATWFYYTENEKLMQTIFIVDVEGNVTETSVVSAGGVDFEDYVSKSKDVVSTYTGDEADTTKIPTIASLQNLEQKVQTGIEERVKTDDIYDGLDSTSTTSPLSANQGKVLNESVASKLDKAFVGDDVANKHLVTDSLGNISLATYDEAVDATSANAVQGKAVFGELAKKFDIAQSVDKVGYVAVVGEDGNMTLKESTALGGVAEVVAYTNESYPDLTNVDVALDKILAKIYYEAPTITSFSMSPATTEYEIGTTLSAGTIAFSWAVNTEITSQSLTDCSIAADDRSATYDSDLSSTKTFILSISDGETTASATKKISFLHKVYWGSAAEPDEYDSAFILSLTNSKFAATKSGSYSMTVGSGEYGYVATPTSFGMTASVWIGGFEVTLDNCGSINFTNASGNTSSFTIYRTGRQGLGSITMEIK